MKGSGCLLLAALVPACEGVVPEPDLERMLQQRSYRPFERSELFADRRAMRHPPAGTISLDRIVGNPALTEGMVGGEPVRELPVPIDHARLERGRARFTVFCAACHGLTGTGESAVARNMTLRPPPSLVAGAVRDYPPGRIYRAIAAGYGLMPSYANELTVDDRWAVVAYLEALRLSQAVPLMSLPPDVRADAEAALR